jgi:hypothetical protein
MKCPACGNDERQRRVGQLWHRPEVVYHCEECDEIYLAEQARHSTNGDDEK